MLCTLHTPQARIAVSPLAWSRQERRGHFPTLDLPLLPLDPSKVDIHSMLKPIHIARLLRRLQVLAQLAFCSNA